MFAALAGGLGSLGPLMGAGAGAMSTVLGAKAAAATGKIDALGGVLGSLNAQNQSTAQMANDNMTKVDLARTDAKKSTDLATIDSNMRTGLATIDSNMRTGLATIESSRQTGLATIESNRQTTLSSIDANKEITISTEQQKTSRFVSGNQLAAVQDNNRTQLDIAKTTSLVELSRINAVAATNHANIEYDYKYKRDIQTTERVSTLSSTLKDITANYFNRSK